MKIMILATKTPWPPIDGGRLLLLKTMDGLTQAGHELTLVAPVDTRYFRIDEVRQELSTRCRPHLVPAKTRGILSTLLLAEARRRPLTIIRHSLERVRRLVGDLLEQGDFDVVHAEQQQAMVQAEAASSAGVPIVLRAQNVESMLWAFASQYRSPLLRPLFKREAKRLARWEGRSMSGAATTMALTRLDAAALQKLGGPAARVEVIPALFDLSRENSTATLEGDPSVVLLASNKWLPNRDAVWSFVADTWPRIQQVLPTARLHVFGIARSMDESRGVIWHPAPASSSEAFPAGSIVVIPARHPTGVPMKCLEAFSRGLPVVGSSEAANQLEAKDGREMLIADDTEGFARAMVLLYERPELIEKLRKEGTRTLRRRHSPEIIIPAIEKVYREAVTSH